MAKTINYSRRLRLGVKRLVWLDLPLPALNGLVPSH